MDHLLRHRGTECGCKDRDSTLVRNEKPRLRCWHGFCRAPAPRRRSAAVHHPVPGAALQSIGSFANGCIIGADTLPVQSDNYQVMRTDQRAVISATRLVVYPAVESSGAATGLVLDRRDTGRCLPEAAFNGGHASHQTGLDVDIFCSCRKRWPCAAIAPAGVRSASRGLQNMSCRRAGRVGYRQSDQNWRHKTTTSNLGFSSIRLLNNSFAPEPVKRS